jgi:hypothetical protein
MNEEYESTTSDVALAALDEELIALREALEEARHVLAVLSEAGDLYAGAGEEAAAAVLARYPRRD